MFYRFIVPLLLTIFGYTSWYHYELTKNKLATFERIINHDSLRIWTQNAGNLNKPTCLFIAGTGASARFWSYDLLQQIVDAGFYVIIFDNRDTGLSSAIDFNENPYTAMDLADDAIAILNKYNIKKAHIIGHSMGALVGQLIAINYPKRILSMTSISSGTIGKTSPNSQLVLDMLIKNKPTQDFKESLPILMKSWKILNGNLELDRKSAYKYTKDLYIRSYHPINFSWNHIKCQEGFDDLGNDLAKINIPTLFIHGKDDPLVPVESGIATAKTVPNSILKVIPCMGYTLFNKTLEDKIARMLIKHFQTSKLRLTK
jgi:pimeloyl-ACP methyl ester carboxylesterase